MNPVILWIGLGLVDAVVIIWFGVSMAILTTVNSYFVSYGAGKMLFASLGAVAGIAAFFVTASTLLWASPKEV